MYTLEFYALDGASVVEGHFDTLEAALDRWNNIGSRWYFYPIGVVFNGRGTIAAMPADFGPIDIKHATRKYFQQAVIDNADLLAAMMED